MVPRLSTITSEGSHDGPQKEPTPMRGSPSGFRLACLDGVNSCHEGHLPFDGPHTISRAAYLTDLSVDANSIKIGAPPAWPLRVHPGRSRSALKPEVDERCPSMSGQGDVPE